MWDDTYANLLKEVLGIGEENKTRNGNTLSCFGKMICISDLEDGKFPILTTRRMYPEGIFGELAAFVRGATRLLEFKNFGCNYWDDNAADWLPNKGLPQSHQKVGRIYGAQWRNFAGTDQLRRLLWTLKHQPESRRHVLTAYNPAEVDQGCLPPCHLLVQYAVRREKWLESCVYMRSVDLCVGLPTDVVLYAALQVAIAHECDLYPGAITFMMGDAHIYENHVDLLEQQLARESLGHPEYTFIGETDVCHFTPDHLILDNYKYHDPIKYPFNV